MLRLEGSGFRFLPAAAVILVFLSRWLWTAARQALKSSSAGSWPSAEARIETFYVTRVSSKSADLYALVLQYSYVVEAERYSGSVELGTRYSDRDSAAEAGRAWVGEKIHIRYKPADPATSIWRAQDGAPDDALVAPSGTDDGIIDLELNK